MNTLLKRTWISPLVAISFFIVSITGLMMMTHTGSRGISSLHEWMGVLFIIAGAVHLILNWKPFLACFRNRQCTVAVLAVLVLSSLFLLGGLSDRESPDFSGRGGHGRGFHH